MGGDGGDEDSDVFESQDEEEDFDAAGEGAAGGGGGLEAEAAASQYSLFSMLLLRSAIMEVEKTAPPEFANIKIVDVRICPFPEEPVENRRRNQPREPRPPKEPQQEGQEDEDAVSEGDHAEMTGPANWPGKPGGWWRVEKQLGENLIVREGVSLRSAQIRAEKPGDLVQQAGHARCLLKGNSRGCIRLPIRPNGWVTADAVAAGGPRYLKRASVPRWRVVYVAERGGTVIVRQADSLQSPEVMQLRRGDIVEQAAPCVTLPDGVVRMPITQTIVKIADVERGDVPDPLADGQNRNSISGKTMGWVTVDASAANGPTFFKPVLPKFVPRSKGQGRQ